MLMTQVHAKNSFHAPVVKDCTVIMIKMLGHVDLVKYYFILKTWKQLHVKVGKVLVVVNTGSKIQMVDAIASLPKVTMVFWHGITYMETGQVHVTQINVYVLMARLLYQEKV